MQLTGIHHLTAISADAPGNKRFYTGTMGMRMVKKTVNQDDTSAYHLFYADALARPGTDLTFFDWPAPREQRGTHSIARTALRIAGPESFQWWKEHLNAVGAKTGEIAERDGRLTLDFEDPEGQRLSLIDDGGAGEAYPWEKSPVPAMHQIRGLGPISLSVPDLKATEAVLTTLMGMREVRSYPHPDNAKHTVHVFEMGEGGAGAELHVAVQPDLRPASQGAGGVHHVAFRTPDNEYDGWAERLNKLRVPNSGKVDRFWFRSLYSASRTAYGSI
jgi:glyoxalase family protein